MTMISKSITYETIAPNGSTYRYEAKGSYVGIYVNGKYWGSPPGDHFIYALLMDIEKLKSKERLNNENR